MAFDIDGAPEATNAEVSQLQLECLFTLSAPLLNKAIQTAPQLTCVSRAGFVSGSTHTCSFPSGPAIPATK